MLVLKIILAMAILFIIHSILPTYINKYLNSDVIRNASGRNNIILSFDDGPDTRYIYELEKVLDKNGVKAIFFMVAENARKNPEVVEFLKNRGHKIGSHSWEHKNAMLYSLNYTKKDFKNSVDIMKNLGISDNFYRPPWGHTNIFSTYFAKKYNMKMIYWDVMAEDWKGDSTPEIIAEKLLNRTKENSIICLHDAGENSGGDKDAPLNTIRGLEIAIPKLKEKGYNFTVDI